ncbi:MAG: hypothetical protein K2X66_14965 [Cyanobacteria bacterium]|nr:hypothetical protein [Cyanobacteriota bacterium]
MKNHLIPHFIPQVIRPSQILNVIAFLIVSPIFIHNLALAQGKKAPSQGICPYFQSVFPVLKTLKKANTTIAPVMSKVKDADPIKEGLLITSKPGKSCEIALLVSTDCMEDSTPCTVGHYEATQGGQIERDETVKKIKLSKGITGYFYDAVSNQVTGDSWISWQSNHTVFTVGRKLGTFSRVKQMANQVISGTP